MTPDPGELVVLNVWLSTCAPCKDEMPLLARMDELPKVTVVGVTLDQFEKYAHQFMIETKSTMPSWMDSTGYYVERYSSLVPTGAVPVTIVARDKRVVAAHIGPLRESDVGYIETLSGGTRRGL